MVTGEVSVDKVPVLERRRTREGEGGSVRGVLGSLIKRTKEPM